MARITLNITEEAFENTTGGFPLIPAGKYQVNVYEAEAQECKSKANEGKPQVRVQFKIQDGQGQDNRRLFKTFNFWEYESKKEAGKFFPPGDTVNFLKALGYTWSQIAEEGIDPDELVGEELELTVRHEEKKTKDSNYKETEMEMVDGKQVPVMQEFIPSHGYRSMKAAATAGAAKATATADKGSKKTYSL